MPTVFVHGRFRQGCRDHQMIDGGSGMGKAETVHPYALCIMDNKPLVTKRPVSPIKGEVYVVSDEIMQSMDRREGHPHINKREVVPVRLEDGSQVDAWLYFHLQPLRSSMLIASGDYLLSPQ